ncbi:hypothetical protein NQ318_019142 [Aromia moschata]|uniref:Cytochrome P450 n=1 Tax=Aromia moschata TaxID=1265417 RepID=A0AAV8YS84_9CUCU|nr:hypothetical protein NQ318_019142 [Aromia moschata]
MWLAILFTFVIAYIIYYFCFKPYNYWKNRNIVYEIPLPLVGNFGSTLLRKKHVSEVNEYLYKKYSNERYVGIYVFTKPALLVRDIELIRRICVEEFDHFSDRVTLFDKDFDSELGNVLTNLKGKQWKKTRDFLELVFAPAQMKGIFDLMSDCTETLVSRFSSEIETLVEVRLYDVFSKLENDITCSTCFAAKNDDASFKMHQGLKNFGPMEKLKMSLIQIVPCIAELFEIQVYPTSKTEFFKKLIMEAIQKQRSAHTPRHDFVHYLMEAKSGALHKERDETIEVSDEESEVEKSDDSTTEWTDDAIATQALIFLNSHSGLEPFITATSFVAYELALHPDVQVKLQEEIDNVLQTAKTTKVTYEAILKMKYLDCVVSESLRKWPPIYQIDRECVKNYFEVDLSIPDDEKIVIEKGTAIIIPIMAIHRDPNYFPDPQRFNPERFSAESRDGIAPGTYIPFGYGPRRCIGSQFALLQMKLLVFHLLSKFDLVPTENTRTHLEASPFKCDRPSVAYTVLGLKHRKVTSL